ncbi:MAG: hypothetical protein ACJ79S_10870 [Gemmatimonadaceae bacterium]
MRFFHAALLAVAIAACGGRQVEVGTGPRPAAGQSQAGVQVNNRLTQPINVYVVSGGSDIFLRQVAPNSSESLTVQGVASGSTVTLRATTVDGTRTYTKENFVLNGTTPWTVP